MSHKGTKFEQKRGFMSAFADELRKKAGEYCRSLEDASFRAAVDPDSLRDYSIKVDVWKADRSLGRINIYYKPSKESFSARFHEISRKAFTEELQAIWDNRKILSETEIYIDGSYINDRIGWGAVILKNGEFRHELSGEITDSTIKSMRQVGGELKAAMESLQWCRRNGISSYSLYFDYEGIRHWAAGSWQAKNPFTRAYRDFMQNNREVNIDFIKVAAHSGDRWNDRADLLAKKAAGYEG